MKLIWTSFSPLAAFALVTQKLRASMCHAANRNGYCGAIRFACLKTL
jgi:hypothetical protein